MKELLLELFYQKFRFVLPFIVLLPIVTTAQTINIIDEAKNPIEGVSVYIENSNLIGLSNKNGKVDIKNISSSQYLTFSAIGYKTKKASLSFILKNSKTIVLERYSLKLDKVIIMGRNEQYLEDIIPETDIISQKEIQIINSKSTADALAMSGNIFVQKSQFGGGSPVMRGFEANRVLMVLDGVRMNNAIYRSGHLQNSITIDNFSLKRMEVIFGPGSLTYGSDAIGGVIHFKTKDPVFDIKFSDYKFRYSSAAHEKTGFIGVNFGLSKFASLLVLSNSNYSDLRAGHKRPSKYPRFGKRTFYVKRVNNIDSIFKNPDYNIQIGTAYSQINILSKSVYQFSDFTKLSLNIQYSTSSDIPRYDFLTENKGGKFKYAEWYYGPQFRFLSSLRFDLSQENMFYDNAVIIIAMQKIKEDRIQRKFGNNWRIFNFENLRVFSFSNDFKKYFINKNNEFVYGVDFQGNVLDSKAYRQNILTDERKYDILSRYPSNQANNYRLGGYFQYVFGERDYPYQINIGSRIETNHIRLEYEDTGIIKWDDSYLNGVANNNFSYAFSLGAKYRFLEKWKISCNISTAFRNPNIDDLGKIRVKKGELLVPNPNLKTEKSSNLELSIKKGFHFKKINGNISATGFYTILNDAIIRNSFTLPDGSSFYIDGGDTLLVTANQNTEKEKVYGLSVGMNAKIGKIDLSSNMVYTKGDILENGIVKSPAAHIPPLFGNIKIGYTTNKLNARYIFVFNAAKPINQYGGSVDNPENATVDGTYAWATHNIYLNFKLLERLNINFAIENILDIHYRNFSSGVSASGRNFIIGISGKISKN